METKRFVAGNWLRGYYEGTFASLEEAWSFLSTRFLLSYPSEGAGRHIGMWVEEPNAYGIKELIQCKQDVTERNSLDPEEVRRKCKQSTASFL